MYGRWKKKREGGQPCRAYLPAAAAAYVNQGGGACFKSPMLLGCQAEAYEHMGTTPPSSVEIVVRRRRVPKAHIPGGLWRFQK